MGCAPCAAAAAAAAQQIAQVQGAVVPPEDCVYQLEILDVWAQMLLCVKQNNLFEQILITEAEINQALGIVLSATNHPANPCQFKTQLDKVQDIIFRITNTGKCQIPQEI